MIRNVVERALECHESGMKLYQVVDGKPVESDAETTRQYLERLQSLSPEEHKRLRVNSSWRWTAEADCSEANRCDG